jgi:glycosyltransferase involved in cell wall biosynthesis
MNPVVSIIIPAYNYGHYLTDTLKSLQQQRLHNWECWVVDDGSTDATAEVVQNMGRQDQRIQYIYQSNQGQPAARNTGLLQATGRYIQFLDADDMLEPEKLEQQVAFLEAYPWIDIVYGTVLYFQHPGGPYFLNRWDDPSQDWMPKISGTGNTMVEALAKQNIFELGCALFRKESVSPIGNFNTGLQGVEDYDFCFRCAIAGLNIYYLAQSNTNCLMRHHQGSYSKSLVNMYKKELLLRKLLDKQLQANGFHEAVMLNKEMYDQRLKKLHDKMIDQTIKGQLKLLKWKDIKWLSINSSFNQNCYFLPRIIKALISGTVQNFAQPNH